MTHDQYHGGEQSRHQTPLKAPQIQFARGSQQLIRTNRNDDRRRRRRVRCQQTEVIEAEDSVVGAKREAQVKTRFSVTKRDTRVHKLRITALSRLRKPTA